MKKPEEEEEDPKDDEDKEEDEDSDKEEEEDDKKKKFELLEADYNALQEKYSALEARCNELAAFKLSIENAKKDELIDSFYMLSDEDKQDVIANKETYSYDDIEAKLSVICVRKKVSFDLNSEKPESPIVTFNLNDADESVPAFVKVLKEHRENNI